MTAGRSLRTSPPTAGSKLTHQTSPRFIGDVPHGGLGPLQRLRFARLLLSHLLVGQLQVFGDDVGPHEGLDELANPPRADDRVQPLVDPLVNGDGQLLLHGTSNYTCYYTYCSADRLRWKAGPRARTNDTAPHDTGVTTDRAVLLVS